MNRISITLLLILSVVQTCYAQKYKDALAEEAHGPVKTISTLGWTYSYNREGALESRFYEKNSKCTPFSVVRDAFGRIVSLTVYEDEAHQKKIYNKEFEYENGRLVRHSSRLTPTYAVTNENLYDENGLCIGYRILGKSIITGSENKYVYENIKTDSHGNWISRDRYKLIDGKKEIERYEKREITYWEENKNVDETDNGSSGSLWQTLIGKRLMLTTYGISQNGKEVNTFSCWTGENIRILSNGIMEWNNREDGNTSYVYTIEGNRLRLIIQVSGNKTEDKWFEIVDKKGNKIKTESNLGTYRYFRIL